MNKSLFFKAMLIGLVTCGYLQVRAEITTELEAVKNATTIDLLAEAISGVNIPEDNIMPKRTLEHALGILIVDKASALTMAQATELKRANTPSDDIATAMAGSQRKILDAAATKITTADIITHVNNGVTKHSQGAKASIITIATTKVADLCSRLFSGAARLFGNVVETITVAKDAFVAALNGTTFAREADNYDDYIAAPEL